MNSSMLLPPPMTFSYPALLPPQAGAPRKTLVLDLDRTLIDCMWVNTHINSILMMVGFYADALACHYEIA